jgi:histidyl-tRNA synthetase
MFGIGKNRVSTESYKGVRDFYPQDQNIQNYIYGVMKKVAQSWGYLEYSASILEPLDLYKSKSSEEIVNEQIYSFIDRGGRDVALRPEMTPTVARMVAAKIQDLPSPIRWYSIPNLFRYEKPQRGRLREHWQLNLDMFGVQSPFADAEVINIAVEIMLSFGAKPSDFVIKINSRSLLDDVFHKINIDKDKQQFIYRLLDKKEKMPDDSFKHSLFTLIGEQKTRDLLETLYFGEGLLPNMSDSPAAKYLNQVINTLRSRGITNLVFTPTLTRGFDYYTGVVFEVFDTNKENPRSIFGGGRYDDLVGSFTSQSVPAFGFGMGDVTIHDFLLTHDLMPDLPLTTDIQICIAPETDTESVYKIAEDFRKGGIKVSVDISGRKLSDQLKSLDKRNIPFVMTIGPEEIQNGKFVVRNTKTREEKSGSTEEIISVIRAHS